MPRVYCVNMGCEFEGELPVGDPCPECGFHGFLHPCAADASPPGGSGPLSPNAENDPHDEKDPSAGGTA